MKYRIPEKTAGNFYLPSLGFGTYQIGGTLERNENNDDKHDIEAIIYALSSGITHIDTAESYADGFAEQIVGKAIKKFDRNKLFITSKVYWNHLSYDDLIQSAHNSLERLGSDYLDLYLIHGPNPNVSFKESMRALNDLASDGKIRNLGVSNFDVPLLEEAQKYSAKKIVNNQIHYSLWARAYEENGTLAYCKKNQILVTAYRPIGKNGELAHSDNVLLRGIAQKYKKTTAQVAIRWLLQKENIVTLFKTSNKDHFDENMGALGWELDSEDEINLDNNFPKGQTINVGSPDYIRRNKIL